MRLSLAVGLLLFFFGGIKEKNMIFDKSISPTIMTTSNKKEITGTGAFFKTHKVNDYLYYHFIVSCDHTISYRMSVKNYKYENKKFLRQESSHAATILWSNKKDDVSILMSISNRPEPLVELGKKVNINLLDEVYSVGCGLGDSPRYAEGKVTGLTKSGNILDSIRSSIPLVPGDSGCGLYNKKFQLIGIGNSIRQIDFDGKMVPVEAISVFKSIDLIFDKIKTDQSCNFIFENNSFPEILPDYLYLLDCQFGF